MVGSRAVSGCGCDSSQLLPRNALMTQGLPSIRRSSISGCRRGEPAVHPFMVCGNRDRHVCVLGLGRGPNHKSRTSFLASPFQQVSFLSIPKSWRECGSSSRSTGKSDPNPTLIVTDSERKPGSGGGELRASGTLFILYTYGTLVRSSGRQMVIDGPNLPQCAIVCRKTCEGIFLW